MTAPRYIIEPVACLDCGAPFNDADAPASGLCAECSADHHDDELAAETAARDELLDWEDSQ